MTATAAPPLNLSEADLQRRVMDLALLCRWRVCHVPTVPVRRRGVVIHMTAYEGHSGLPDLILARSGRVLLVELKAQQGRATVEQRAWLAAAGPNGRLWKPSDWDAIVAELSGSAPTGETP